jgi:5-methylcytosine-specific restriction endonuclease McrA
MSELSKTQDREIRSDAKSRCGYCLGEQKYILAWLEIEHILPRSKGGTSTRENLWLACPYCNTFKGSQTQGVDPATQRTLVLFNPRKQIWKNHFEFGPDQATIIGNLNYDLALETRKLWVNVGWYPPKDL